MVNLIKDVTKDLAKNKILIFMLLPAVLFYLIFAYLPMAGIVVAFKRLDYAAGIFGSPWVGLDNFKFFFISGQAFKVTRNTILYNAVFIIINTIMQITVAIFLSELSKKYFKKITQTMLLMPYFVSWVVVSAFVYNIFNYEYGMLNNLLKSIGADPIDFLGTVGVWKYLIVFLNTWKEVGYGSIIYLAAISSIERGMYESAEIDGASMFQQVFRITIPNLKPTIIILVLLSVGYIFRGNFSMFYQLVGNNGTLYNATDVIDTFVFRSLINTQEFGMASAAGLYQSILCFIILIFTNYMIRRSNREYALF